MMINSPGMDGRENAEVGVFITLEDPSGEMKLEATAGGVSTSPIDGFGS